MSKEKLICFLDKFHIKYKKYGEELKDAIDITIDNETILTLSQFDDDAEVCTASSATLINEVDGWDTVDYGWKSYGNVIDEILEFVVNK